MRRAASFLVAFVLAALPVSGASACTCRRVDPWEALLIADAVAEVRVLEVGPAPEIDPGVQRLRVRFDRVFAGPPGVRDGAELWIGYRHCNSEPFERRSVGERWIAFMSFAEGRLEHGYCAPSLSSWEPVPLPLIEARERRRR